MMGYNDISYQLVRHGNTEEVVEKTFKLKRRYGVALNKRGEKIVQSTPTYGSDSQIIIKEVEQLLLSKGLVKLKLC